jgi:glycosyltransferase involved in cell wall biosynthesis
MNILFVTPRIPKANGQGDQVVSYRRLTYLARAHSVTLVSYVTGEDDEACVDALRPHCREIRLVRKSRLASLTFVAAAVFLPRVPFQVAYNFSFAMLRTLRQVTRRERFDVCHIVLVRMAFVLSSTHSPVCLELVDSMALNMGRRLERERGLRRVVLTEEVRRLRFYERRMIDAAAASIVVSEVDQKCLGSAKVTVVPLGVPVESAPSPIPSRPLIIFTGNMFYYPNELACLWFASECFPRIRQEVPGAEFRIVGRRPSKRLAALTEIQGVTVSGEVESIGLEIEQARLAVAPMQAGSGMQFKILEAMAKGRPVVATTLARGSIAAIVDRDILISDDAKSFADSCVLLLQDDERAARVGMAGFALVNMSYSWDHVNARIDDIYKRSGVGPHASQH